MFTIKYRTFAPVEPLQQDLRAGAPPRAFQPSEQLHGPFLFVSQEHENGYVTVHCHSDDAGPGFSFGPCTDLPSDCPRPTVWVMNEHGATVAKYDL